MTIDFKMSVTDATTPFICAISICGADWKHDKFSHNSPTANFSKWSKELEIHLSLLGLKFYVFPAHTPCPNASTEPVVHGNWIANNNIMWAVILTALDDSEYEGLNKINTAASLYDTVKSRVEGEGPVHMVALMQEVLKIQCTPSESLTITVKCICNIVYHIFAIKALDEDIFKCVMLLNSLNNLQYASLQAQVS